MREKELIARAAGPIALFHGIFIVLLRETAHILFHAPLKHLLGPTIALHVIRKGMNALKVAVSHFNDVDRVQLDCLADRFFPLANVVMQPCLFLHVAFGTLIWCKFHMFHADTLPHVTCLSNDFYILFTDEKGLT